MSENVDLKMLEKHLAELSEHFDSVHIFVTRHEQGESNGTINANMGTGNWFTRYGQILEWQVRQDENSRITAHQDNANG